MEETACPLCKERDDKILFNKESFDVVKCKRCSLVYVNPRLTVKESQRLYNAEVISPSVYYKETKEEDYITFQKRLQIIEKYAEKGKILDIGCNIGTFLEVAKESGWKTYGIDINEGVKKECLKKGIKFFKGTVAKVKFQKNFFDAVIMNDLIEHVHNPQELLQQVKRVVKPQGIIFIVTPDVGSYAAKVLKKRWPHFKPNEHLIYFSRKTLRKVLESEGFVIKEMKHIGRWRKMGTIIQKGQRVWKEMRVLEKIVPASFMKISMSCNFYDELYVIAQKSN